MYETVQLLGRCICLSLALATLGLSIMITIVPSDYGSSGELDSSDRIHPPLFTFIFVGISLVLNIVETVSHTPCYNNHFRRLHSAFVLVFDLIASLGLLLSAFLIIFPTMSQFLLVRDLIWISTALAAMHMFLSVFACVDCDRRRRAYRNRNQQEIIQRRRERALRMNRFQDVYA